MYTGKYWFCHHHFWKLSLNQSLKQESSWILWMVQHNTLAYKCECERKGGIHYLSAKFTDVTSIQRIA